MLPHHGTNDSLWLSCWLNRVGLVSLPLYLSRDPLYLSLCQPPVTLPSLQAHYCQVILSEDGSRMSCVAAQYAGTCVSVRRLGRLSPGAFRASGNFYGTGCHSCYYLSACWKENLTYPLGPEGECPWAGSSTTDCSKGSTAM
jgi:hypothetical protein